MDKLTSIKLVRVHYMPKTLESGVLYVSEEFGAALHLCACGCRTKVSTPLGPTEWNVQETANGPSLNPSVGNWQLACKSHYWIWDGQVIWSNEWTPKEIAAGRQAEETRRLAYYDSLDRKYRGWLHRLWRWFRGLFRS